MKKSIFYPGLANLGNTCFINSCIQILNSIDEIHKLWPKYFIHMNPVSPYSTVLIEWEDLKKQMQNTDCVAINPAKFLESVYRIAKKDKSWLQQWQQNDATEFFIFMIDCFHKAVKRSVSIRLNDTPVRSQKDNLAYLCYSMLKREYEKEYSEFIDLFQGIQYSSLTFKNNKHSITPQFYSSLGLPIPQKKKLTIFDCLDEYCKPENMEGENACLNENTGKRESAVKRMRFWNFPKILCITFQRFCPMTGNKNPALIDFPFVLDLSTYVDAYHPNEYVYELFGICNHIGGLYGGHYNAFVKSNHVWRLFDDTNVKIVETHEWMITPMAYCLFYRKIGQVSGNAKRNRK